MVNIKKYNHFINESVIVSDSMAGIIHYLARTKHDKVSIFLSNLIDNSARDFYEDDEILNFIGLAKEDNMVTYLPTNKRISHGYQENFDNTQRVGIRIGRAVKKIYDTVSKYLKFEKSVGVNISIDKSRPKKILIDIPSNDTTNGLGIELIVLYDVERDRPYDIPVSIDIKLNGKDVTIKGNCIEVSNYWGGFKTMVVDVDDSVDMKNLPFTIVRNVYDVGSRRDSKFDIMAKIEAVNKFNLSDADIEKFVNEYISYVKGNKSDDSSKIEIVSGEDIRKWYFKENYQSTMGKLGGSCMAHEKCSDYLDIYVQNPESVSMLILKNKADKLIGRALLWNLDDGTKFMDRVYTANDYDDNIFYNYAIENGYLYRNTPAGGFKYFKNGKEVNNVDITVTLDSDDFDYYPYMDTLFYLSNGVLYNNEGDDGKTLKETEGRWSEWYDENEDDDY